MKRLGQVAGLRPALIAGVGSLLLYLRTLAPDVVFADGGEFQFGAWNFAFVHPTGYPLYLILGGLFQHLVPLGNPAFRLNLFSALAGSAAVAALCFAVTRMTGRVAIGWLCAAAFAVSRTFWFDSGAAEVYPLGVLFLVLLVGLALAWESRPESRILSVFALVAGLALTHHRTVILWLPAFALFIVVVAVRSRIAWATMHVPRAILLFLIPLLLYVYIPLRAPASPYFRLPMDPTRDLVLYDASPLGFVNYVLGRTFQSEVRWDAVSASRLAATPGLIAEEFGMAGIVLGLAGLVVIVWQRRWPLMLLTVLGFAATIFFASAYHIGDIQHYYLSAFVVWTIWIGAALGGATSLAGRSRRPAWALTAIFVVGLLLLPVPQAIINWSAADRSQETAAREQWEGLLATPLPQSAILVSNDRDEMMPLWYMQYVENRRRDLLGLFPLITPGQDYSNLVRVIEQALTTNRPVYLTKPMPGLEVKYQIAPFAATLQQVQAKSGDVIPKFVTSGKRVGSLGMIGYDYARLAGAIRVTVFWSVEATLDRNVTSYMHLTRQGIKIGQGSDHVLGGEYYPSSLWPVGEKIRDEQTIELLESKPGLVHLVVGMYSAPEMQPLGEPVDIGEIDLR